MSNMETFYNELHSYVQKIAGQIVDLNGGNPVVTGVVTQALGTYYVVKLIEGDSESSVKAITVNNNLNLSLNDSVYLIKANSTLDSAYYIIGKMESIQEAFLNLTLAERFQAVGDGMTIALNTDITDSTIIDAIKEKGAFQISGTFTCQKNTDDYGVKVTLYNGSAEIKSYELNTHYFVGQPFNMIDMVQSRTVQLDETTLNSGFNKIKVTTFGDDFSYSNVKLSAGFLLNIDGVIKVAVAAVNDKDYFSKVGTEFENTVQLKTTVTYEGQEFAANGLQYYWLIKDDSITSASKEYLDFVGDGWKCLNSYTEVDAVGIEAKLQLWDNKNSIITFSDLKDFPNFINTMKCVIKYQQVIAESEEFEIYNYNKESFYAELESNFIPAQIIAKEDRIQLTCKIKDRNEQSDIDVYDADVFQIEYNWFYRPAKSEDEQGNNIVWDGDWKSISDFTDAILFIKDDNIVEKNPTAFELFLTHKVDGEEKEYINYQFYCQVKISKKEEDGTVSLISTEITDPIHVITKIQAETTIHAFDYYKYCLSTSMSESFSEKEGGSVAFLKTLDKQIYSGKIYYKQASTGLEEDTELGENALFYTEVSEPTVDELNLYYERFELDKDWIRNSNNLTLIKNLQYEKIAEQNATGQTYSFSLENDVYTIKSDAENHSSYYIVEFIIPADINVLKINYQQSSEVNYDYAFFSKVNTALTKGTSGSDTNSIANTKGMASGTIVYDLSSYSEDVTIQIKFRRDYNGKGGTNSISFSFYADYVFKDWVKTDPVINETAYNYISENFEDIFTSGTIPVQSNPYLYYTRQTIWFEERDDIYFFLRVDGYSMPVVLRQVGLDSNGNSTNIKYGNSISQINTFNQLTQYGKEEGIFYQDGEEGDNHLYINASFINTGTLRVGDANNEKFYASLDEDEVKIAGFTVDENSIFHGNEDTEDYVYLGTDGLNVGNVLDVTIDENGKASASFTGSFEIKDFTDNTGTIASKDEVKNVQENLDSAQKQWEEQLSKEITSTKSIINEVETDLQNQIDGNITTWYGEGIPTFSNNNDKTINDDPAKNWTDAEKNTHNGDLYYDKTTGKCYRWQYEDENTYSWVLITDTDIAKALADAADAQTTADNKKRIFYGTASPKPPYDYGDAWMQGENAGNGAIKICILGRKETEIYVESDWVLASDFITQNILDSVIEDTKTTIEENYKDAIKDLDENITASIYFKASVLEQQNNDGTITEIPTVAMKALDKDTNYGLMYFNTDQLIIRSSHLMLNHNGTYYTPGYFTIDTDNLKLNEDGDVTVTGQINATSLYIGETGSTKNFNDIQNQNEQGISDAQKEADRAILLAQTVNQNLKDTEEKINTNINGLDSTIKALTSNTLPATYLKVVSAGEDSLMPNGYIAVKSKTEDPNSPGMIFFNTNELVINSSNFRVNCDKDGKYQEDGGLYVEKLSALSADLGTITAGIIQGGDLTFEKKLKQDFYHYTTAPITYTIGTATVGKSFSFSFSDTVASKTISIKTSAEEALGVSIDSFQANEKLSWGWAGATSSVLSIAVAAGGKKTGLTVTVNQTEAAKITENGQLTFSFTITGSGSYTPSAANFPGMYSVPITFQIPQVEFGLIYFELLGKILSSGGIIDFTEAKEQYLSFPGLLVDQQQCLITKGNITFLSKGSFVALGEQYDGLIIESLDNVAPSADYMKLILTGPKIQKQYFGAGGEEELLERPYTKDLITFNGKIVNNIRYPVLNGQWYVEQLNSDAAEIITSDENAKYSIQPQSEIYSQLFDKFRPIIFKYEDGTSNRYHTGLIAQEVEQAVLEIGLTTQDFAAICYSMNPQTKEKEGYGIRYSELVSMCIYEIQQNKIKIKSLESKVAELENLLYNNI